MFGLKETYKTPLRTLLAWAMLSVFVSVISIKAFHIHTPSNSNVASGNHDVALKGHDDCLICLFVLSPFVEGKTPELQSAFATIQVPVYYYLLCSVVYMPHCIKTRGPPAIC